MRATTLQLMDSPIAEALKHQSRDQPILLTRGSDAVGLLIKLPEGLKESDIDGVIWLKELGGGVVIIEAQYGREIPPETGPSRPVFGSCKGMMTMATEDDDHLSDFAESMR